MDKPINAPPRVYWTEFQGNKYNKSLHPAMLTEAGYTKTSNVALLNDARSNVQYVTVVYDRLYVVYWLKTKVIKPLENLGITEITKLIREAWKVAKSKSSTQLELDAKINGKI